MGRLCRSHSTCQNCLPNPTGAEHYIKVLDANMREKSLDSLNILHPLPTCSHYTSIILPKASYFSHMLNTRASCQNHRTSTLWLMEFDSRWAEFSSRTFANMWRQPAYNHVQQRAYPLDSRILGQPLAFHHLALCSHCSSFRQTVLFQTSSPPEFRVRGSCIGS